MIANNNVNECLSMFFKAFFSVLGLRDGFNFIYISETRHWPEETFTGVLFLKIAGFIWILFCIISALELSEFKILNRGFTHNALNLLLKKKHE